MLLLLRLLLQHLPDALKLAIDNLERGVKHVGHALSQHDLAFLSLLDRVIEGHHLVPQLVDEVAFALGLAGYGFEHVRLLGRHLLLEGQDLVLQGCDGRVTFPELVGHGQDGVLDVLLLFFDHDILKLSQKQEVAVYLVKQLQDPGLAGLQLGADGLEEDAVADHAGQAGDLVVPDFVVLEEVLLGADQEVL